MSPCPKCLEYHTPCTCHCHKELTVLTTDTTTFAPIDFCGICGRSFGPKMKETYSDHECRRRWSYCCKGFDDPEDCETHIVNCAKCQEIRDKG